MLATDAPRANTRHRGIRPGRLARIADHRIGTRQLLRHLVVDERHAAASSRRARIRPAAVCPAVATCGYADGADGIQEVTNRYR
ncbi:hypothetical protein C5E45_17955 [Nocardia nova]|uniref:Uncharacterized protein n=1 Tax=Nocardia nova TaxID=37330 RepID=A0A2S6AN71_9NOCA|nr:hypothetical protein C5E41_24825 [Nocardia nova]PPJ36711.1 hypothetical protein C5E45_17955 [Nocardia nova]